ncbi:hypothetical protein B9Z55_000200 [Caenorhabditis nigoni]|uniref:Uncharacterized protein n=1 Tax=Caenorhabditis nigoni TaxID=1611254 RepID=A0A2G5VIU4_9PELO|nr:hypothetical protein B9Z55_000200 [Caenorhabditis nigoni]
MENKQFFYENLETVLTYMEPSCRFNLALKIPSIRKAEKDVPLHIDRLELYDNRLVINKTEYCMRVWRKCQSNVGLYNGEVDDDLGKYGSKINVDETIEPGDIKLGDRGSVLSSRWPNYECPEQRAEWLQHDCPMYSLPCKKRYSLPCQHFIRLYVIRNIPMVRCTKSIARSTSMYQFPYASMKIYQLMKRLLTIFFGNRRGEWTVGTMSFKNNVLRWPVHTRKPIVREFDIGEYTKLKMNILNSIINLCVPLNNLQMTVPSSHDRIADHPMFLHADHVTISNQPTEDVFSDLFSFQAHTVVIANPPSTHFFDFESALFVFMEEIRPIGVRWSILTYAKKDLTILRLPDVFDVLGKSSE